MSPDLAAAALDLARVFTSGGRLVVTAPGRHDHAQHVAVEFIHPAIVGARSLPAVASPVDDLRHLLAAGRDALLVVEPAHGLDQPLQETTTLDAALVLRTDPRSTEPELVRWYHILWELVQVGLEHPGLTGGGGVQGGDSTSFLYPFLDARETDEADLVEAMRASTAAKEQESNRVGLRAVEANEHELDRIARAIAGCRDAGGTVHAIGNGGSASDGARLARLLRTKGVRAVSLAEDPAVLTALANDLGVERIFARQVEASVRPGDVLVVLSTSGSSPNLLAALDVDVVAEVTTVTSSGYGGGPLADHPSVDHRLIVESTSTHRIQEAQGVLVDRVCALLDLDRDPDRDASRATDFEPSR